MSMTERVLPGQKSPRRLLQDNCRRRKKSTARRERMTPSITTPRRTRTENPNGLANAISYLVGLIVLVCILALQIRTRHGHLRYHLNPCHPHLSSPAPLNYNQIPSRSPFSTIAHVYALLRPPLLPYSVSPSHLGRMRRKNPYLPHRV